MRLSPPAWLTAQLFFGVLVLVGMAWIFGAIAEDVVTSEPLTILDAEIARWFHLHAIEPVTRFMLLVSLVNGVPGISFMSALWAIYLGWRRDWYWLLGAVLAVGGGILLNVLVKLAFHRARPSFDDPLVVLTTYSFPSGHTAAATVFYGALGGYLLARTADMRLRLMIAVAVPMVVVVTGLSRIYLGAHYLTDVLAAVAEGTAWLALCLIGVGTLQRRRAAQPK